MTPVVRPLNFSFLKNSEEEKKESARKLNNSLSKFTPIVTESDCEKKSLEQEQHPSQFSKIIASSQRESLQSARSSRSCQVDKIINGLEKIPETADEEKLNRRLRKHIQDCIKRLPPAETPDTYNKIAKKFYCQSIDTWSQKQHLANKTVHDLACYESPRARSTFNELQTSSCLTEKIVDRIEKVREELLGFHKKQNAKSKWSEKLYLLCMKISYYKEDLPLFMGCFDPSNIADVQIQQIMNQILGSEKVAEILRSWCSEDSITTIRKEVGTLINKHAKKDLIPCNKHVWTEYRPEKPIDTISAKNIEESLFDKMAEQYHILMVNKKLIDCNNMSAHRPFPNAFWEALFDAIEQSGFKKGDVIEETKAFLENTNKNNPPDNLSYTPLLQLASRKAWEICEAFLPSVFPDLFKDFLFEEIKPFSQSECYMKIESETCFSVTQIRLLEIVDPATKTRLGCAKVRWRLFPVDDKEAKWQAELNICDILIDEKICDLETKWKILDCFIDYHEPPLLSTPQSSPSRSAGSSASSSPSTTSRKSGSSSTSSSASNTPRSQLFKKTNR